MAKLRLFRVYPAILAMAAMLGASEAHADWKPSQRITMLVGYQAGGGADTLARLIAEAIKAKRGWNIIVENKTGAGGGLMLTQLANAKPDGYTMGVSATGSITTAPLFAKSLKYTVDDFTYIGTIARAQMAIIARTDAPFNTLEEFADYARKKGNASVAVLGPEIGLVARLIGKHYKLDLSIMPTKGGAETLTETVAGHIDAAFNAGAHHPYVQSGKLKVIANCNDTPLVLTPKAKSLRESGIDYASNVYFQMQAPAKLPPDILKAWTEAFDEAVKSEGVANLAGKKLMMDVVNLGHEKLTALIKQDVKDAAKLVEAVK